MSDEQEHWDALPKWFVTYRQVVRSPLTDNSEHKVANLAGPFWSHETAIEYLQELRERAAEWQLDGDHMSINELPTNSPPGLLNTDLRLDVAADNPGWLWYVIYTHKFDRAFKGSGKFFYIADRLAGPFTTEDRADEARRMLEADTQLMKKLPRLKKDSEPKPDKHRLSVKQLYAIEPYGFFNEQLGYPASGDHSPD